MYFVLRIWKHKFMKKYFINILNKFITWYRINIQKQKLIGYQSKRLFLASGMYFNGKKQGYFRTYNRAGEVVLIEKYKEGRLISTKHINEYLNA